MNENGSCTEKELSNLKNRLYSLQEELLKFIYSGEEIMDRVCTRKPEPANDLINDKKNSAPINLIEDLRSLVKGNENLIRRMQSFINRMGEVF
jgi:hypothetical protein